MEACNDRQKRFVFALFDLGERGNNTEAARAAGVTGDDNYLHVAGWRLAHSAKVQAALKEEAERRTTAMLPLSTRNLEAIALDGTHKDHFGAVKHLRESNGLGAKQVHAPPPAADGA